MSGLSVSFKSALDVLREARARIEDPARWTQWEAARDADGNPVQSDSSRAVCWCAMGAVGAVPPPADCQGALNLLGGAAAGAPGGHHGIGSLNDEGDHADVLAMFDRAIAAAS